MTKVVSSTILLLLGAALTKLGLSDDLLLYVRPPARRWVLLAGIALLLLAGWSLLSLVRGAGDFHDTHSDDRHGGTRIGWLVLAPVVAVLVIAPPALGAFTANRAPSLSAGHAHAPAPGTAPVPLRMNQLFILANKQPAALAGRTLLLTGFVDKQTTTGFVMARLVITCCAADAFSTTVIVSTASLARRPLVAVNSWVTVTGHFTGVASDMTPKVTASRVTAVRQPADPYEAP